VNWLESIGLVGSWFFNCVVSKVRKVEKFPDSCFIASGWVVAPGVVALAGVTVMAKSFKP
jgi:hypothetical protein